MTTALDPLSHMQSDGVLRFFTGHASVKKMHGALEGTHVDRESSNRKMKHDIRSRQVGSDSGRWEKHKPHGRSLQFGNDSEDSLFIDGNNCFLLWDWYRGTTFFSLFTCWPELVCCTTAEELKLQVPWHVHRNSVYLLDFWIRSDDSSGHVNSIIRYRIMRNPINTPQTFHLLIACMQLALISFVCPTIWLNHENMKTTFFFCFFKKITDKIIEVHRNRFIWWLPVTGLIYSLIWAHLSYGNCNYLR